MKIEISSNAQPGLRPELLAVFRRLSLSVRGIEVADDKTYLDIPALGTQGLSDLVGELADVAGVKGVREVELLPHECQRMQFAALVNAISEPLIAVNMSAHVILANAAAIEVFDLDEASLLIPSARKSLSDLEVGSCLMDRLNTCSGGEVSVKGKPFLVDVLPLVEREEDPHEDAHGAIFIFRSVSALGQSLYAIEKREPLSSSGLIGASSVMHNIGRLIERFAQVQAPVLITGETGTGKELVARACHRMSPRAGRAFLALNCAALPESLAESELFGYAAGAFSGAQRTGKPGLFELADGGTVFLDEIGEMSAYMQAKLLRFLQDGSFMRIGGSSETRVNVCILAATHRDLRELIKSGQFREDLFYRLNVLTIELPPVRDRREDIPELVNHFIARASAQVGGRCIGVSAAAMDCLCEYSWPGNAREMENLLFRAITLAESEVLQLSDLPPEVRHAAADGKQTRDAARDSHAHSQMAPTSGKSVSDIYASRMEQTERELLSELYEKFPSTRKLAAQLGLSHSSVAGKLRRLGIAK